MHYCKTTSMSSAFSAMLDMLSEPDTEDYSEKMAEITNEVRSITLPPTIAPQHAQEKGRSGSMYDEDNTLLDTDVRERFKAECNTPALPLFTALQPTTSTIEGFVSNVKLHERDLIQELYPDEDIVMYRCNFGKVVHDGYVEVEKVRTTNRGRKKKPKKERKRKVQGNGTDFNSQVTCVVRSTLSMLKVHKIKVFRNGKLQLPGVHQSTVEDAIICAQKVAWVMNVHLHTTETDPAKKAYITNLNPVMKNYKFVVVLPPGHIIDLATLRSIFAQERLHNATAPRPAIFTIKYSRQDAAKLSIKFDTPMRRRADKRVRINIFMRGRINILGAFHFDTTMVLYKYLHSIFETHRAELIVAEGDRKGDPYIMTTQNIEPPTPSELAAILATQRSSVHERGIHLSEEEYQEIISWAAIEWAHVRALRYGEDINVSTAEMLALI